MKSDKRVREEGVEDCFKFLLQKSEDFFVAVGWIDTANLDNTV
jgi:hypothetical protein